MYVNLQITVHLSTFLTLYNVHSSSTGGFFNDDVISLVCQPVHTLHNLIDLSNLQMFQEIVS